MNLRKCELIFNEIIHVFELIHFFYYNTQIFNQSWIYLYTKFLEKLVEWRKKTDSIHSNFLLITWTTHKYEKIYVHVSKSFAFSSVYVSASALYFKSMDNKHKHEKIYVHVFESFTFSNVYVSESALQFKSLLKTSQHSKDLFISHILQRIEENYRFFLEHHSKI